MKRAALEEEVCGSLCHMMMVPSDSETNKAWELVVYATLQHHNTNTYKSVVAGHLVIFLNIPVSLQRPRTGIIITQEEGSGDLSLISGQG